MKTCFIISPIGNEGSEIRKRADQLFKYIISPVCENCGFEAVRVDQINKADSITQTIIDYLKTSELVIADMTGHNPNAFYEIGYRSSTGKAIIHVKEKGETIPFDIASIRAFDYDLTDLDSVEEVKTRLEQTINAFNFDLQDEETGEVNGNCDQESKKTHILPVLYQILDQISELKSEIHNKDTETIQAIVKASQSAIPVEDTNTAIMKILLPEMLKNPDAMNNLMKLSEMTQKKK